MTGLIPRAEALRVLDAERECWMPGSRPHAWLDMLRCDIEDIPAHGTCATCAEWERCTKLDSDGTRVPDNEGECKSDAYFLGEDTWIITRCDHFCAAYMGREKGSKPHEAAPENS